MENPTSLTEISALVERTLLDTGRLFRKSGSMPASTHLQRSLPSYYDSFQEALDNLSEQIFIAKAFLEKDYEAIKAREVVSVTEDVTMSEVDQNQNVGQETQPSTSLKIEPVTETANVQPKTEPEVSAPTEATPAPQPSQNPVVKEEPQAKADVPMEQSFPDAEGLNFDSVLNEGGGGSGSFNLSLDFGDDDMGNQAFLSGSAFGSNAPGDSKTGTSQPPENSTTTAPAGGGAFDMELQKSEDGSNAFPDQGNAMDDLMAPGESSFDDLFMENENIGGDGTGDLNQLEGDSLMNLNELEDNWFT
ncbi:hypothetical protein N7540_008249 [Penicillium herquei]|nr:hypothetical protein N7540_008249 [Penicillium herquei]